MPVPVAARCKAWVCGRSLVGIVASNPARGGEYGCLSVVSFVCCQVEISASGWSLVQRSPTECGVCLSVIEEPHRGVLGSLGLSSHEIYIYIYVCVCVCVFVQRSPTECGVCLSVNEEPHRGVLGSLGLSSHKIYIYIYIYIYMYLYIYIYIYVCVCVCVCVCVW